MMNDESSGIGAKLSVLVGPSLNLIPGVGGAIAAAWSEWDTRKRFHRVEEILHLIQTKLAHLRVDIRAADDAGMHLLELILREAQVQHSQKKLERLANILVASWVSDQPPTATFDESLLFLRATEVFTETHITILERLRTAGPDASVPFADLKDSISPFPDSSDATVIVLNDLCSAFAFAKRAWDLNQPESKPALLMSGKLGPEGIARKCFHAITPRGSRYIDHVVRGLS